jgi:hypothetical protein
MGPPGDQHHERQNQQASGQEGVEALRAALKEWTRERVPLNWAMTQHNLGNALSVIGERGTEVARLEDAAEA